MSSNSANNSNAKYIFNPNDVKQYFKGILPPNLEEILKSKKKFTDPYFPPNNNSIDSLNSKGEYIDLIEGKDNEEEMNDIYSKEEREWKRPEEVISGKWSIFSSGIKFNDIVQGSIGDCYFISALAALVEFPELLKNKFPSQNYSNIGYYEVVLYIDGEWVRVFIDNYFPVYKNFSQSKNFKTDPYSAFCFAKPNDKELWAMILEKAWAKVNGGYSNISGGNQYEVLLCLTGFPSEIIMSKNETALKLFKKIENADKEHAVMGCSSYSQTGKSDNDANKGNIAYGHAYTLIDAKSKGEDLDALYLYKIRNPWGAGEWNGDWCDKDNKWDNEELKKYFNFKSSDDGIFFMSADDYPKNFINTQICKILYDAKMRNYVLDDDTFFKGALIYNLYMPCKGDVIFSIVERNRRFNRDVPYQKYPFFSLLIFKYDKKFKVSQFIGGKSNYLSLGINKELDSGYYACVIYFPYDFEDLGKKFMYTFTIYSSVDFKSKFTGKDLKLQCLENLIINYFKNKKDYEVGTAGQYIATDIKEIGEQTNITARIFYNNIKQKIKFTQQFKYRKGYAVIGTFLNKNTSDQPIEFVINKGKFGIILLAKFDMQSGYSVSNGISYGAKVEKMDELDFEDFRFENYLYFDIIDDKDLTSPNKKPEKKNKILSKENAKEIPNINEDEKNIDISKSKIENTINQIYDYEKLKEEYPNEFKILEESIPIKQNQSLLKWVKKDNPPGIYIGQINNKNQIEGRGIFIYNNGKIYIGYFSNKKMNEYGLIYTKNYILHYKGQIKDGELNGSGILYKDSSKVYWVANFKNGQMNGYGLSHNEKGDEWIGPYKDNKQNGVGFMKYKNPTRYSLLLYINGKIKGQMPLLDEEIKYFKMLKNKISNLSDQFITGNIEIDEVDNEKNNFIDILQKLWDYKKENNRFDQLSDFAKRGKKKDYDKKREKIYNLRRKDVGKNEKENKNIHGSTILSEEEQKNKEIKQKKEFEKNKSSGNIIDFSKNENNLFMAWQIIDMYPYLKLSDIKMAPKSKNHPEYIRFIAEIQEEDIENVTYNFNNININSKFNNYQYNAFFDGQNYYIGQFKNELPCGLIRKFSKSKIILMEGQMHQPYRFDDGYAEKYFQNGNLYKGQIINEKMEGKGEITFTNGDKWIGSFHNDMLDGFGKYLTKVGFNQLNATFKNNQLVSQSKIKNNDKFYTPFKDTMTFLSKKERDTLFSYLNEIPPLLTEENLSWAVIKGNSYLNYFVGQVNDNAIREGRGIICYTEEDSKHFYIGQFKNGRKNGFGFILNDNYEIEYEGNFLDDVMEGFGNLFLNNFSYHGGFKNGLPNGIGTKLPHECKGISIEGIYRNGYEYKVNKVDFLDNLSQNLIYDEEGNLINFEESIEINSPDYYRLIQNSYKNLRVNFKASKHLTEILKLEPQGNILFETIYRYGKDGLYIGEVNSLGQRCGRGKLINLFDKSYYIGYWFNDKKEGNGTVYNYNGTKRYTGAFCFGEPIGKGTYFLDNGDIISGNFDPNGSGICYLLDPNTLKIKNKKEKLHYYALQKYNSDNLKFLKKIGE